MGLNDTLDQLRAAQAQSVLDEARIAELQNELGAAYVARTVFEQQIAELERENVRLETALADRMRTDSHGPAAAEADRDDARERLARIGSLVDPRRDDWNALSPIIVRRILNETTAEPFGVYLTPEDALTAGRAIRALAGVIRATSWNADGDQAHADADRLDRLADIIGTPPA